MPRDAISCKFLESIRDDSARLWWRLTQLVGQAGANIECLEDTTGQVRSGLCMRSTEKRIKRTLPEAILHFSAPATPTFLPFPGAVPVTTASAS